MRLLSLPCSALNSGSFSCMSADATGLVVLTLLIVIPLIMVLNQLALLKVRYEVPGTIFIFISGAALICCCILLLMLPGASKPGIALPAERVSAQQCSPANSCLKGLLAGLWSDRFISLMHACWTLGLKQYGISTKGSGRRFVEASPRKHTSLTWTW